MTTSSDVRTSLPPKAERHTLFGSVPPIAGNKPWNKEQMTDLQNNKKNFLFALDSVGIDKIRYPVTIRSGLAPTIQSTIATLRLTTSLEQYAKGINMSRLTELLDEYHRDGWELNLPTLCDFARDLANRMNQQAATIRLEYPWFFERVSPKMGKSGLMHADAWMEVHYNGFAFSATLGLRAAVTTLCPCSKEISEYSAHNQRGYITIEAGIEQPERCEIDWRSRFLEAAESNASSLLYPVLKRPDEKAVTERAYENPRFVEDMVRLVAADLYEMDFVRSFTVQCQNEESIHQHDAYAKVSFVK